MLSTKFLMIPYHLVFCCCCGGGGGGGEEKKKKPSMILAVEHRENRGKVIQIEIIVRKFKYKEYC